MHRIELACYGNRAGVGHIAIYTFIEWKTGINKRYKNKNITTNYHKGPGKMKVPDLGRK